MLKKLNDSQKHRVKIGILNGMKNAKKLDITETQLVPVQQSVKSRNKE